MDLTSVKTRIWLPPGELKLATLRKILRLVLKEYQWFSATRYGSASFDKKLSLRRSNLDEVVAYYKETKSLYVAASDDKEFISIYESTVTEYPYVGSIRWWALADNFTSRESREHHEEQIDTLTRLVNSPLAITALYDDVEGKYNRLVPNTIGQSLDFTVRDPSEGLAGIFWRTFFGPPFVKLFGDKLKSLPVGRGRDFGDGIFLVEPYELPAMADTEEGKARERQIIEHLGRECFYDFETHHKPTRVPELPPPPSPSPEKVETAKELAEAQRRRLAEYETWAQERFEQTGERPEAVLSWAREHVDDPLLLEKTPEEVEEYLNARNQAVHKSSKFFVSAPRRSARSRRK